MHDTSKQSTLQDYLLDLPFKFELIHYLIRFYSGGVMNFFCLAFVPMIFSLSLSARELPDVRVTELKNEIMTMARSYEGKPDTEGKLQNALEDKVQQLERIIPYLSMSERAQKIVGEWRQVFGPYSKDADGKVPGSSVTEHIYQVIFPNGFFYNVALAKIAGVKSVVLLKGKYNVTNDAVEALFVKNSVMVTNLPTTKFYELPAKLERGEIKVISLPDALPPVGTKGQLIEVYADKEIRILRGKSPTFKKTALLIMERMAF